MSDIQQMLNESFSALDHAIASATVAQSQGTLQKCIYGGVAASKKCVMALAPDRSSRGHKVEKMASGT